LKSPWKVFFFFLILYLVTMGGHLYSPDEEILFRTTESLATRGSLSIKPLQGFATKKGKDGRQYAQYGVGQPLLAVPFYYVGKLLYVLFPTDKARLWFVDTMQYNDRAPPSVMFRLGVSFFNQVITALLCMVLFQFSLALTRDSRAAWMATLLWGAGCYAWVHSKPFFTEPLAALLSFTAFYLVYMGFERGKNWLIVLGGTLYAYAILVRLDSLFMLPGFLGLIFFKNAGSGKIHFETLLKPQYKTISPEPGKEISANGIAGRTAFPTSHAPWKSYLFFIPVILSLCFILILNKLRFGTLLSTGYEDQSEGFHFSTPILGGLYGFLFSVGRGMFFFSPPLILFFYVIGKFYKNYRALCLGLLALVLSFFLVQCKWQNWAGGWCWGPRHIYQIHVFLALPLCLVFTAPLTLAKRCVFWVFLTLGAFVQIYGSSQNFIDYHAEFFTTPKTLPNNYNIWYQESQQFLDHSYALFIIDENRELIRRVPLHALVSPLHNALFYPQNSVWVNYLEMLRLGRHDFFWIKIFSRRIPPQENPISPEGNT